MDRTFFGTMSAEDADSQFDTEVKRHASYLYARTPLSERQSEVLALRRSGKQQSEIADILDVSTNTVKSHWERIFEKLAESKEFRVNMGPHPWGEKGGWDDSWDKSLWELAASASFERNDRSISARTRVELELFAGAWKVNGHEYLWVEREIVDTEKWETTMTEKRSCHGPNGLRSYALKPAESLREYYIRGALLAAAGVDPGADYAPSPESLFSPDITKEQKDDASSAAQNFVTAPSWDSESQ